MSSPILSLKSSSGSKRSISNDRENALSSSWIKRLCPSIPVKEEEAVVESYGSVNKVGPYRVQIRKCSIVADGTESAAREMTDECMSHNNIRRGFNFREMLDDGRVARSSNNYINHHAVNFKALPRRICDEEEEQFSYWDMGKRERDNFVCSVIPDSSSALLCKTKKTVVTNGIYSFPH